MTEVPTLKLYFLPFSNVVLLFVLPVSLLNLALENGMANVASFYCRPTRWSNVGECNIEGKLQCPKRNCVNVKLHLKTIK